MLVVHIWHLEIQWLILCGWVLGEAVTSLFRGRLYFVSFCQFGQGVEFPDLPCLSQAHLSAATGNGCKLTRRKRKESKRVQTSGTEGAVSFCGLGLLFVVLLPSSHLLFSSVNYIFTFFLYSLEIKCFNSILLEMTFSSLLV